MDKEKGIKLFSYYALEKAFWHHAEMCILYPRSTKTRGMMQKSCF